MGRRMTCPGCGARTSSIVQAFVDGEPCPSCGLPHDAAAAVVEVKARQANEEVTRRAVRAEMRAAVAENELRLLKHRVEQVVAALASEPWGWTRFHEPTCPSILDADAEAESYIPDVG